MTIKNPSINETSDKIRERSSELILKDKLKSDKILQDRQHKLDLKINKKTSKLAIIAIIISTLSFLFSIFIFYDNKVNKLSTIDAVDKQQTTIKATNSNEGG